MIDWALNLPVGLTCYPKVIADVKHILMKNLNYQNIISYVDRNVFL